MKKNDFSVMGVGLLMKVLHLQPMSDSKDLKQMVQVLDKLKVDLDDDGTLRYLQIFQHICNKEIVGKLDTEAIKKVCLKF